MGILFIVASLVVFFASAVPSDAKPLPFVYALAGACLAVFFKFVLPRLKPRRVPSEFVRMDGEITAIEIKEIPEPYARIPSMVYHLESTYTYVFNQKVYIGATFLCKAFSAGSAISTKNTFLAKRKIPLLVNMITSGQSRYDMPQSLFWPLCGIVATLFFVFFVPIVATQSVYHFDLNPAANEMNNQEAALFSRFQDTLVAYYSVKNADPSFTQSIAHTAFSDSLKILDRMLNKQDINNLAIIIFQRAYQNKSVVSKIAHRSNNDHESEVMTSDEQQTMIRTIRDDFSSILENAAAKKVRAEK